MRNEGLGLGLACLGMDRLSCLILPAACTTKCGRPIARLPMGKPVTPVAICIIPFIAHAKETQMHPKRWADMTVQAPQKTLHAKRVSSPVHREVAL